MRSLWFVVPVYGRTQLAGICLRQLRRTCDLLTASGLWATAVVVGDDGNLDTAADLGFATIRRDNRFVSRKFNDGIQAALDPELRIAPTMFSEYEVSPGRPYRGHDPGTRFIARLPVPAESRAIGRGDITVLRRVEATFDQNSFTPPEGWNGKSADYVVPCGSDDWIDHQILLRVPSADTILVFHQAAFVNERGDEIVSRRLDYQGGVGIRVYPRQMLKPLGCRPADEDLPRGCDTSILVNVKRSFANGRTPRLYCGDVHGFQVVDWKSSDEQLNAYDEIVARHLRGTEPQDPFETLAGIYPDEALDEMREHYARQRAEHPTTAADAALI